MIQQIFQTQEINLCSQTSLYHYLFQKCFFILCIKWYRVYDCLKQSPQLHLFRVFLLVSICPFFLSAQFQQNIIDIVQSSGSFIKEMVHDRHPICFSSPSICNKAGFFDLPCSHFRQQFRQSFLLLSFLVSDTVVPSLLQGPVFDVLTVCRRKDFFQIFIGQHLLLFTQTMSFFVFIFISRQPTIPVSDRTKCPHKYICIQRLFLPQKFQCQRFLKCVQIA